MSEERSSERVESYAARENAWVRERILKNDTPAEGSLKQISERARRMAVDSLGAQHVAHGVALLNLGIYYDLIEHDSAKAREFIDQARNILRNSKNGSFFGMFSDALFQLGTARKERNLPTDDPNVTESYLSESLAIERKLSAEELAATEAVGTGPWMDRLDEACAYHSRDKETAAANLAATGWETGVADSLDMIAVIVSRHRDYLRQYGATPWGCNTSPQMCKRLAAFAPNDAAWLRRLANAYEIIGNEQSAQRVDQLSSLRASLFFQGRLLVLTPDNTELRQRAADLRKRINEAQGGKWGDLWKRIKGAFYDILAKVWRR